MELLIAAAVLVCPLSMGLMMFFMHRHKPNDTAPTAQTAAVRGEGE